MSRYADITMQGKKWTHLQDFKLNPRDSKKKFDSEEKPSKNKLEEMRQCIRGKKFVKI